MKLSRLAHEDTNWTAYCVRSRKPTYFTVNAVDDSSWLHIPKAKACNVNTFSKPVALFNTIH
jgi:hypothetical protein